MQNSRRCGRVSGEVFDSSTRQSRCVDLLVGYATEALLYRRLETLPETTGRFGVNVVLPIAFDGMGQLEVDLLCADARVAVELDGAQHLADTAAYRRDRRKDQLLQENGYMVLRFLAEDVGKELDLVLDAVLRALGRRESANPAAPLHFVRRGRS